MRIFAASLLALSLLAGAALAADAYVDIEKRMSAQQRHATGIDKLDAAELAALNAFLRGQEAEVASGAREEAAARAPGTLAGFNDEPIRSRLVGEVSGWEPGTVFELENGQRWKVLKGSMRLPKPMHAPEIRVVPGLAGRWFLEVDADYPKARVYRID
jgi:hypothetical protein